MKANSADQSLLRLQESTILSSVSSPIKYHTFPSPWQKPRKKVRVLSQFNPFQTFIC